MCSKWQIVGIWKSFYVSMHHALASIQSSLWVCVAREIRCYIFARCLLCCALLIYLLLYINPRATLAWCVADERRVTSYCCRFISIANWRYSSMKWVFLSIRPFDRIKRAIHKINIYGSNCENETDSLIGFGFLRTSHTHHFKQF